MNDTVRSMLGRYQCETTEDYTNALREILQELALLGLWRSNFFEQAAFYGGTALRVIYGTERYSEDLDFSLLQPDPTFTLEAVGEALEREIQSYGFSVYFQRKSKTKLTSIESAFLKTNTVTELLQIEASQDMLQGLHPEGLMKIKLEVDTDPPAGFQTETKYLLQPVPFAMRVYALPDLFAGKLHAVLFRSWGKRVKGRDWYDLIWFAGRHPEVDLQHLEQRMRQSGHWDRPDPLNLETLDGLLKEAVLNLDIVSARSEVAPFVRDPRELELWSREFFMGVIGRIREK